VLSLTPTPEPTADPVVATTEILAAEAPAGHCDPSYPGVCLPPAPPDLDCPDIASRRFQVVPPDSHRFDGDHDGMGCESG
jgi:micrococcal nuclease